MLPNLATLAVSPGNVLVRCPECASLFRKASPTGCTTCGGKRKRMEKEGEKDDCSCKKECACDDDDDAVPDPNDPNMSEQWRNAYLKARGISYGSLSAGNEAEDNPEPWQIEEARRKLAPQDRGPPQTEEADDPDQPVFRSGCTDDDCEPMFSSGCTEEDCEPQFQSLGADPEDGGEEEEEESEDESEGEGDDVGDWRDDANFDYYRAVGRPPYTP